MRLSTFFNIFDLDLKFANVRETQCETKEKKTKCRGSLPINLNYAVALVSSLKSLLN